MTTPRLRSVLAAGALAMLVLAGCTVAAPPAGGDATPAPDATSGAAANVPECDGILLEAGGEVEGATLAACMSAAMFAAGSGAHRVENSAGVTEAEYEWTPEFALSATGELAFVIRGDDGWVQLEGRWVRGDAASSDPEEMFAGTLVEAVRAFGDPRAMTAMFAQTSWAIVESGPVPATDAVSDTAWLLEPNGPIEVFGVTATDMQLWLGTDYLGVYFVATASVMGITETTSNTFLQWGEPVEIPDPGV